MGRFMLAIGAVPGVHVQRIHVLKVRLPSGAYMLSTTLGTADTVVVVGGHVVWCEWKTRTGTERDSQIVWRAAIEAAGGTVWLCRSSPDTVRKLAELATGETRERLLARA